jgi:hypothetical protein
MPWPLTMQNCRPWKMALCFSGIDRPRLTPWVCASETLTLIQCETTDLCINEIDRPRLTPWVCTFETLNLGINPCLLWFSWFTLPLRSDFRFSLRLIYWIVAIWQYDYEVLLGYFELPLIFGTFRDFFTTSKDILIPCFLCKNFSDQPIHPL